MCYHLLYGTYTPPTLEYLSKQEVLEFSWPDIFASSPSRRRKRVQYALFEQLGESRFDYCTFLRIFFNYGGYVNLVIDDKEGNPIAFAAVARCFLWDFCNPDKQRAEFNKAVIAFCLMLKHGFHPTTQFPVDSKQRSILEVADWDPDFTRVAWKLALELHGWPPVDPSAELNTEAGDNSVGFEETCARLFRDGDRTGFGCSERKTVSIRCSHTSVPANTGSTSLEDERSKGEKDEGKDCKRNEEDDEKCVPGAWVLEEPKSPVRRRKFRSRFTDFRGVVRGVEWDPELYLPPAPGVPLQERMKKVLG